MQLWLKVINEYTKNLDEYYQPLKDTVIQNDLEVISGSEYSDEESSNIEDSLGDMH